MKNRQLEAYKKALKAMEEAVVVRDDLGVTYWDYSGVKFAGLCGILRKSTSVGDYSSDQFVQDSKKILNKDLKTYELWFTDIGDDEPKARQERFNHLKELIKLYENEKE